MKIIFLDVDGVLNNMECFKKGASGLNAKAHPDCVAVLNGIIEQSGASVVISSTWRLFKTLPEMRELLAIWGVRGARVIGRTPYFPQKERGEEIQAWLDQWERSRDAPESFVILDDDGDMGRLKKFLVQTTFDYGLSAEHSEPALAILGRK